jgi:hypothetical protein
MILHSQTQNDSKIRHPAETYVECRFTECRNTNCNNAEYRYAMCHGTPNPYSVKSKV